MSEGNNNEENLKSFHTAASSNKSKSRLNPGAQWLILEKDTVNRIRGQIDYANTFLKSFRLSLHMEVD